MFTTKSNGGVVAKFTLTFATLPTVTQQGQIACGIANQLGIVSSRVFAGAGIGCVGHRRRLLQTNTSNTSNTTAITTPVTPTGASLSVYVEPDNTALTDTTLASVTAYTAPSNLAKIQTSFASIAGLPAVSAITQAVNAAPTTSIAFMAVPTSSSGITWAALSGLQLTGNGYIYCLVDVGGANMPTSAQVRASQTASGGAPLFYSNTYFLSTAAAQMCNWTNATAATNYSFFYMATNDDPTNNVLITNVSGMGVITLTSTGGSVTPVSNTSTGTGTVVSNTSNITTNGTYGLNLIAGLFAILLTQIFYYLI